MTENEISRIILDECFAIHQELGPGLLETVYEVVLAQALQMRGLHVERQVPVPIEFRGLQFDEGFRADLMVEGKVLIELKSVEAVKPVHGKQVLTHLRLTGLKLGLLVNFGERLLKDGIKRVANGL
jgi:GxxExxY protein